MNTNYTDIRNLETGSNKQKKAFQAINETRIFEILSDFNPFLAGTIPIDIDVDDSDLDIICETKDFGSFENLVKSHFAHCKGFSSYRFAARDKPSLVLKFISHDFKFEIFCQDTPVIDQYAVIHFLVEKKLLEAFGDDAKKKIRKLKEEGLKTEPAFAKYFNIPGDPYIELAKLKGLSKDELKKHFT